MVWFCVHLHIYGHLQWTNYKTKPKWQRINITEGRTHLLIVSVATNRTAACLWCLLPRSAGGAREASSPGGCFLWPACSSPPAPLAPWALSAFCCSSPPTPSHPSRPTPVHPTTLICSVPVTLRVGARSTANQNSLCEVLVVTDDVQCMSCRGESRLVELCRSREEPPGQKFSLLTLICYWWVTKCELDRLLQCTGACHQTHHLTLAEDPCNKLGEHTHLQFYCAFNHTHTHTHSRDHAWTI